MQKSAVIEALHGCGVVAVVRATTSQEAIHATRALARGGIRAIEITFTVPDAAQTIAALAREAQAGNFEANMLLGAGTVLTREQARLALDAGAQFLVSPCIVPDVIEAAQERAVAMLPGALTPTEICHAYALGGDIIKVFPASHFGSTYFKDLKGPLPHIPLLPTGGIDETNARAWLEAGAVALGVGGKLVDRTAMAAGDWNTLTERARALMAVVGGRLW